MTRIVVIIEASYVEKEDEDLELGEEAWGDPVDEDGDCNHEPCEQCAWSGCQQMFRNKSSCQALKRNTGHGEGRRTYLATFWSHTRDN